MKSLIKLSAVFKKRKTHTCVIFGILKQFEILAPHLENENNYITYYADQQTNSAL